METSIGLKAAPGGVCSGTLLLMTQVPHPPESPKSPSPSPGQDHFEDWRPVLTSIRNRLLTGLAVAFPLIVTLWLLALSYSFILTVGRPLIDIGFNIVNLVLGHKVGEPGYLVPASWFLNLFGIAVPLVIFFFLGSMARNVIGGRIIDLVDRIFLRFPIVSSIYSAIKQMIDAFKNLGGQNNFQRVVYIYYPSPGSRLVAFVTGQYHDQDIGKPVTTVFLPTSPNPMTGFVLIIEDSRVMNSKLTVEQAMKMIISAGLVAPVSPEAPAAPVPSPAPAPSPTPAPAESEPVAFAGRSPIIDGGLTGYEDDRH